MIDTYIGKAVNTNFNVTFAEAVGIQQVKTIVTDETIDIMKDD